MKLLFVCLGNICRSPAAEAIMTKIIADHNLSQVISCDSAGISDYHQGEPADSRMTKALKSHGYTTTSTSRQLSPARDYDNFDYILAMDRQNLRSIMEKRPDRPSKAKIHLICELCSLAPTSEIPDPYYQGENGFHHVISLLEEACTTLLDIIRKDLHLP